jgi:hypothetical protein
MISLPCTMTASCEISSDELEIKRVHRTSRKEPASHHPRQILGSAKTLPLRVLGPEVSLRLAAIASASRGSLTTLLLLAPALFTVLYYPPP